MWVTLLGVRVAVELHLIVPGLDVEGGRTVPGHIKLVWSKPESGTEVLETENTPSNRYVPAPVGPQILTDLCQHVAGSMFPSTAVGPVLRSPLQVRVPDLTHTHTHSLRVCVCRPSKRLSWIKGHNVQTNEDHMST